MTEIDPPTRTPDERSDETTAERTSHEAHERLAARADLRMFGDERIVMVVYPGFTALDLIGPQYFLAGLMGATLHIASTQPSGSTVGSDTAVEIATNASLADLDGCDVLVIPGSGAGLVGAMADVELLEQLRRLASGAHIVASVCTGSLILAAAGLLTGRTATSHWVARELLTRFGVEPRHERLVIDGDRWSAAGVTAGIDLGAALAGHLRGDGYRRALELQAELITPNPGVDPALEHDMRAMFALTLHRAAALAPPRDDATGPAS